MTHSFSDVIAAIDDATAEEALKLAIKRGFLVEQGQKLVAAPDWEERAAGMDDVSLATLHSFMIGAMSLNNLSDDDILNLLRNKDDNEDTDKG